MSSCSPLSFVFDSSPSLKPLKASGSLSSVIKSSPLKASGSLPSLDFSKLKSFKSSASMPSWMDTLNKIKDLNFPVLSNNDYVALKGSITPKSFDFLENYKPNSLKASSSISSWKDTLSKINFPILESLKSSSSPKSVNYMNFNIPKVEPRISWKSSSSPKVLDYFKNYFDKIKLPTIEPIKNNLEASVSFSSIFEFSHVKAKENNLFRNLNKNEDKNNYSTQFNYLDVLGEMQKSGHDFVNQRKYHDWKGAIWSESFKPKDVLYGKETGYKKIQLHVHQTDFGLVTGSNYKHLHSDEIIKNLTNYEAAIEDLKPGKSFFDKIMEFLEW